MMVTQTGKKLVRDLGLSGFKYYWIQKIINAGINVFVVTTDSRYPHTYLPYAKVKDMFSTIFVRGVTKSDRISMTALKLTPPIPLDQFSGFFPSQSVIIRNDVAGEYYGNRGVYKKINEDSALVMGRTDIQTYGF